MSRKHKNISFSGCSNCGEEPTFVHVPVAKDCGDVADEPCTSNKGKFYDRLTDDFVVPDVGREAKMQVCEGNLWSKCQWVGVCLSAEKYAFFQITKVSNKSITILNGCRTGDEIAGNPEKGTVIGEGTVIFPAPPQGCSQGFCNQLVAALKDCGADAIIQILKESEEICFTNVPEIDETERVHLFGGIMPSEDCECDEYGYGSAPVQGESLWTSCLRKLTKIFTNVGGRTICFSESPLYDKEDDPNNLARFAVFDKKGCLRRGDKLISSCSNLNDVAETGADAIYVCSDGNESAFLPTCGVEIVGSEDNNGDPKWIVREKGIKWLSSPVSIASLTGTGLSNSGNEIELDLSDNSNAKCRHSAVVHIQAYTAGESAKQCAMMGFGYYTDSLLFPLFHILANGDAAIDGATFAGTVDIPIIDGKIKLRVFSPTGTFPSYTVGSYGTADRRFFAQVLGFK